MITEIDPKNDMDIANPKMKSRLNDKTVISTANLIPSKREVTKEDVNNFIDKIKKSQEEKN